VSFDADRWSPVQLPLAARAAVATAGVVAMWVGVVVTQQHAPIDLTVVLLVLLAVVLGLALVTGPVLGIVTSLVAVVLVNWYLVPPFGTFEVASTDNLVALIVFALVTGVVSVLVELNARILGRAARSQERAGLIADLVAKGEAADPELSLERVRHALELDRLSLVRGNGPARVVLATVGTGPDANSDTATLTVAVPGGYRLLGIGPERIAEEPGFVESLAAAAVRSYESDRMETEQQRAEQLTAVDSARTALLASVGHDLRTPLSGLRLAVDALKDSGSHLDEQTRRDLLDTVDDSTTRLSELITNLLDMSRLEAGVLAATVEPTAIDAVVAAALIAGPSYAQLVRVDVDESLPLVLADPALLERVIENIVSNAVRYAGPTSQQPVDVSAYPTGDSVVVDVVDHGPGLGERVARDGLGALRASGRADRSTGLGLEIVRRFCAAMDVGVAFLSTDGGGLTVRITLPIAGASR
jgi:K+-sensing histidine kinase KdpD